MVSLFTNDPAVLCPEDITAPFLIGDIKLIGPSTSETTWRLSYRLAGLDVPLVLTVFQREGENELLYALICAPRFDYYAHPQNGPQVSMMMDAHLAGVRVLIEDMPADRAEWPGLLLSTMARMQKPDEILFRNASAEELNTMLQDASDLLRRPIDVVCAAQASSAPAVFIDGAPRMLFDTIIWMVYYFFPLSSQPPARYGWLDDREGTIFGRFKPRELSARDRTDASLRLIGHLRTIASHQPIGKRALLNRVNAFGALGVAEKAAAE